MSPLNKYGPIFLFPLQYIFWFRRIYIVAVFMRVTISLSGRFDQKSVPWRMHVILRFV